MIFLCFFSGILNVTALQDSFFLRKLMTERLFDSVNFTIKSRDSALVIGAAKVRFDVFLKSDGLEGDQKRKQADNGSFWRIFKRAAGDQEDFFVFFSEDKGARKSTFLLFRPQSIIVGPAVRGQFTKLSPYACRQRCLDEKRFTCQSVASCVQGDCFISDLHGDELTHNAPSSQTNVGFHSHCLIYTRECVLLALSNKITSSVPFCPFFSD